MTPVLEVEDLTVDFGVEGRSIAALRGVNFAVNAGERVGIVGESGSGKSLTARAIMRLLPQTAQISQWHGQIRRGRGRIAPSRPRPSGAAPRSR